MGKRCRENSLDTMKKVDGMLESIIASRFFAHRNSQAMLNQSSIW
jgi:hypothetical protein